jgi:hypothetical protein
MTDCVPLDLERFRHGLIDWLRVSLLHLETTFTAFDRIGRSRYSLPTDLARLEDLATLAWFDRSSPHHHITPFKALD